MANTNSSAIGAGLNISDLKREESVLLSLYRKVSGNSSGIVCMLNPIAPSYKPEVACNYFFNPQLLCVLQPSEC